MRETLLNIESYRLSLNRLELQANWREDLQRLFIIRSVHGTTAIEGNPLSEHDVAAQLTKRTRTPRDQVHRQTENAEKAFRWIEKRFSREPRIAIEDILHMHELLTKDSDEGDNHPGCLREPGHNVTVGSHQLGGVHRAPPGGDTTRRLVEEFVRFINSREFQDENPVIQALVAHFYFVTLHPFGNGNGRTTRCIEAAILFGAGYNTHGFYSLSNFFYRNRDEYFRTLQDTRTKHGYDLTEFLRFGLRGFQEELQRINAYVRNRIHEVLYRDLIRRCSEQRIKARRRLLNGRETKVLHALLDATQPADPFSDDVVQEVSLKELGPVLSALYQDRTERTIFRELTRLEQLGFIRYQRNPRTHDLRLAVDFKAISRY
jgi:Fic family protein